MAFTINDSLTRGINNGADTDKASVGPFTPAAGDVLLAFPSSEDATFTVSGGEASLSIGWAQIRITSGATHCIAVWGAVVGTSASMTIVGDNGQAGLGPGMEMKVYVITGANPLDPFGADGAGTSSTVDVTVNLYNSTVDNSRGFFGAVETVNNLTTPSSSDTEDAYNPANIYGALTAYKAADTTPAATTVTGNLDTTGGTAAWKWIGVEILPPSPPDAPTIFFQAGGHERAGLEWTAGASNGGSAVTGHKIRHATAAAPTTWLGTTDTSSTLLYGAVTGLTNSTAYVFQVLAYNAIGDGAWSSTSGSATPTDVRGFFLLENGDKFLLENGDRFLLESGAGGAAVGPGFRRRPQQLLYR